MGSSEVFPADEDGHGGRNVCVVQGREEEEWRKEADVEGGMQLMR